MPIIATNTYKPPLLLSSSHFQTIYPSLFRKVDNVHFIRERIDTADDDFLDIDWSPVGSQRLGIISHGLEGNTQRGYVKGMVRMLNQGGWDALAWNFRGCSGEPNRQIYSYHSGKTEDLERVVEQALATRKYQTICLIGYSMGGNITLKYLGERGSAVPSEIKGGVAFSVPCDLSSSADQLGRRSNRLYMDRFLKMLHLKVSEKMEMFPGQINDDGYHSIKDFKGFDDRYTAPLNGFEDAEDYWRKCSSVFFLEHITCPILLINAQDDPFLSPQCYPRDIAENSDYLFLETPSRGGHVGFVNFGRQRSDRSERRALDFINDELG